MMLTPSYLTTYHSEESPRADHTLHDPSLTLSLKNFSLKVIGELECFEHWLSGLLAWHLQ